MLFAQQFQATCGVTYFVVDERQVAVLNQIQ